MHKTILIILLLQSYVSICQFSIVSGGSLFARHCVRHWYTV